MCCLSQVLIKTWWWWWWWWWWCFRFVPLIISFDRSRDAKSKWRAWPWQGPRKFASCGLVVVWLDLNWCLEPEHYKVRVLMSWSSYFGRITCCSNFLSCVLNCLTFVKVRLLLYCQHGNVSTGMCVCVNHSGTSHNGLQILHEDSDIFAFVSPDPPDISRFQFESWPAERYISRAACLFLSYRITCVQCFFVIIYNNNMW